MGLRGFDVVLNRHESFSPRELARVLTAGGRFVTQQVGGDEAHELGRWFGEHAELPHVNLTSFANDLERAGFATVEADEHVGAYVFRDVAALLAYLQRVPWENLMTSRWTGMHNASSICTRRPMGVPSSSPANGSGYGRSGCDAGTVRRQRVARVACVGSVGSLPDP